MIELKRDQIEQFREDGFRRDPFAAAFEIATVSNRKLARYYLRSMELAATNEAKPWHIPNDDRSINSLEHILPEKPEGN